MTVPTKVRNASLEDLVPMLQAQAAAKLDAVVPAQAIRSEGALLRVDGLRAVDPDAEVTVDDVLNPKPVKTTIRPTEIMDGQIATKLGIPQRYLTKLRAERPDLYDANVNGWLHGVDTSGRDYDRFHYGTPDYGKVPPDGRKFMLRTFMDPAGGEGIGRALLSDKALPIENLTTLMAALRGVKESGVECHVVKADVTERRMNVRFAAPGITAMAPTLLHQYRPQVEGLRTDDSWVHHTGIKPGEEPIVFAGFDISNSETGGGAFDVRPVITVKVCKNGLVLDIARYRRVHLGSRMEEGLIDWSHETLKRQLDLIVSQTQDAVKAFLKPEFIVGAVETIEAKAGVKLENPADDVVLIAKNLQFTEDEGRDILSFFIKGGQDTAGGVVNAITAYAQTLDDADRAYDLETAALKALDLVPA